MKQRIYLIIIALCSLTLAIGLTTAWFEWSSTTDTNVSFDVEGLGITYTGNPTLIKSNLYPTEDMTNPDNIIHNFSLVSSTNTDIYIQISLDVITFPDELKHESFKWSLFKEGNIISYGNFVSAVEGTNMILPQLTKVSSAPTNYTLYIWIDGANYSNPLSMGGKSFEFNLKIEASQLAYQTPEYCFEFDEITGTITKYLCGDRYIPQVSSYSNKNNTFESSLPQYMSLKGTQVDISKPKILPTVKDIIIPDKINGVTVQHIGEGAFAYCGTGPRDMSSSNNNNTTEILPYVNHKILAEKQDLAPPYNECEITNIIIPETVLTIGSEAFSGNHITNITIPINVTSIGQYALRGISTIINNTSIAFDWTNIVFGYQGDPVVSGYFEESMYKHVTIIKGPITSNKYDHCFAFEVYNGIGIIYDYRCDEGNNEGYEVITDLEIPSMINGVIVAGIAPEAFAFNQLTSVTIPNSCVSIWEGAFNNNQLPDNQAYIYNRTDTNSDGIAEIDYSTIVSYGGANKNISIPKTVSGIDLTTIEASAFAFNTLISVTIPNSVTSIGRGAFNNNQLPDNQAYIYNRTDTNSDGIAEIDYSTIVSYGGANKNISIPKTVSGIDLTTIEASAFKGNQLTSVTIPNSVTSIGGSAFGYNQLTSVTIPNSVTSIGDYAFADNQLTSVTIPNSVTYIYGSAFSYNNLTKVYIGSGSNLTETTGIGSSAFTSSNRMYTPYNSGITYVDNPNLTTIYNNSGKKFKWYYITQGRNNSIDSAYNFITGPVPLYTSGTTTYNAINITTGGTP